ncbi:MAG: hypothetical protein NTV06_05745 [candidate division Zixibacteria bacterium]|nr:hypothetical protein [candidate division Zixibacteria bacterium]
MVHIKVKQSGKIGCIFLFVAGILAVIFIAAGTVANPVGIDGILTAKSAIKGTSLAIDSTSQDTDSIVGSKPAGSNRFFVLTIPAVVNGYNADDNHPASKGTTYRDAHDIDIRQLDLLTTAGSISPDKALEFTLIGAKPSGTS